jgi:opacity protein-like surface antigen
MIKRLFLTLVLAGAAAFAPNFLVAQDQPAALGPGGYISLGGGASVYQFDYGQRKLGGVMMYTDINPTWRYGLEGEVRSLRYHTDEDVTETTYLAGPRIAVFPGPIRPYVKLLAGVGSYSLPFHLAEGNFFTYAPGAGVDVMLTDYVAVRVIDFEYQVTTQFHASPNESYSQLVNYGLSAGISIRLTPLRSVPRILGYKKRPYGAAGR